MTSLSKIHFHASKSGAGHAALDGLVRTYGQNNAKDADIIVVLGGDGTMLEALHSHYGLNKPFYGMNRGSVGFMLNPFNEKDLHERLKNALQVTLRPLRMVARTESGAEKEGLAFNEVSLLRQLHHAAKITVTVDGIQRLEELVCDGILVSTPAGSTAYNLSAHGPILPLKSDVLALTPISAFRPRRWRGALLPSSAAIRFDIRGDGVRPVSATADYTEVRDVTSVDIRQSTSIGVDMLFDPNHTLEERILKEQFLP
jgi:NAD+ kinase